MENVPVIRIGARRIQPEYLERYEKWMREVYFPWLIGIEGIRGISRYWIVKERPDYNYTISIMSFGSLRELVKHGDSPEYQAYLKDQNTMWASRSELVWSALYQLIRKFGAVSLPQDEKEELKPESAPLMHLEGHRLAREQEREYNFWFTKWGNEVYIPLLMKLPGLKEYARYKFMCVDTRYASAPDAAIERPAYLLSEYPAYLSILRFENLEAFENYEKSMELVAFREAMKTPFPKGLDFQWYVQYQLMRSWRK